MTARVWTAVAMIAVIAVGVSIDLTRQARAAARGLRASAAVSTAEHDLRPFVDSKSGISLCYPTAWRHQSAATAELAVAAPAGQACLSLDVPAMSWHPIFIPIGLVASRYVEDLRHGRMVDGTVTETVDLKVAGATARRVTTRGHDRAGATAVDTAVVIVHAGQVYILSCDSDAPGAPLARRTLDVAVGSVRWTK